MPNFQLFVFCKRMLTSEISVDESSSSGSSEIEFLDFETLSDGCLSQGHGQSSLVESEEASSLSAPVPYDDELIADAEWIEKYQEKKASKAIQIKTLQGRLEGTVPITDW